MIESVLYHSSFVRDAWLRLKKNHIAMGCVLFLIIMSAMAIVIPWISPYQYSDIHLEMKNQPPSLNFWFGTDDLGRDIFCRTWWGARTSLAIGISAALLDITIGVIWGATSAYFGKWVDEAMMRICDILQAIPRLLTVILLTVWIGAGFKTVLIALAINGWVNMGRIARAQFLQIKQNEFIIAARSIGASGSRIIFRHFIPNALGCILTTTALAIPTAIFTEAFLSFLGLGLQIPSASWGIMINEGINAMGYYPWRLFFPSVLITLTMLSFNMLGNALHDAFNPRL